MSTDKHDIEDWAEMWDEMQESSPEFEDIDPSLSYSTTDPDLSDPYYQSMDLELFQEGESTETPDVIGPDQTVNDQPANPLYPTTTGPDSAGTPPVWLDNKILIEIEEIQNKMFDLENKIAASMGGDGEWVEKSLEPDFQKYLTEMKKLRKKLEELSSKVGLEKGCEVAYKKRQHMGFNN